MVANAAMRSIACIRRYLSVFSLQPLLREVMPLNAKNFSTLLFFGLCALVVIACGQAKPTPNAPTTPSASTPVVVSTAPPPANANVTPEPVVTTTATKASASTPPIALLLASSGDDRSQQIQDVFIRTAQALTTTVLFNQAEGDAAKQKKQVAEALGQGVQVLVIQPVDQDAAASYVDAAHKAGARVVALDRLINTRDLDAYVAHDDFRTGQLQATEALRWLAANKVKTPWNFVLLEGAKGDKVAAEITRGYYDVLKASIDKKQVVVSADEASSDWSSDQALKTTQTALTKTNNNLHAVLANNPALARGAMQALDQQKLLGKVFVAGASVDTDNLRALCNGQQNLAVVEDIKPLAVSAAQLAAALASGQSVADTNLAKANITVADKQVPYVQIPVQAVTLDTAQAVLVQSGRYTPDQLGKCMPALADGAVVPRVFAQGTITLWTQEDADVYAYLSNLAAQFTAANPGVQIRVTNYDADTLSAQFQSPASDVTPPDLVWTTSDQADAFARDNLIQPVEDWIDATPFLTVTNAAATVQGKRYGVPVSVGDFLLLYYNKKLLKDAPADTSAFAKLAPTLTKSDGSQWTLVFDESDPRVLIPWLGGFKGKVWAESGLTTTLNTVPMTDTLGLLKDWRDKKVIPSDADAAAADNFFKQGKAAMIIAGDAMLDDYAAALGDNLGVARLTKVAKTNEYPRPYAAGKFLLVTKDAAGDKLTIAKGFAQFLTSRVIQLEMTRKFKRLPALREALSDSLITNDALLKPAADEAQLSLPLPVKPEMKCVWDALKPNMQAVITGKATPVDAAKAMQESAEACLAKQ